MQGTEGRIKEILLEIRKHGSNHEGQPHKEIDRQACRIKTLIDKEKKETGEALEKLMLEIFDMEELPDSIKDFIYDLKGEPK